VIAAGRDVNILVLDTEVYSNTGARPRRRRRSARRPVATAGKPTGKKDLG